MTSHTSTYTQTKGLSLANATSLTSPIQWLRAGFSDFIAAPGASLFFGLSFSAMCALAYAIVTSMPLFAAACLTVLLAIGPFLAAAAYRIAQLRERGQAPSIRKSLNHVRSRVLSIGLFSGLCALIVVAWVRLSSLAFAIYYSTLGAGDGALARIWTEGYSPSMAIFLAVTSIVLALTLFAVSVTSLPRIADQNGNIIEAIHSSVCTLRTNASSMLVWISLLIVLIAAALFSGLLLMPVVFPVLAYATWHSYRQLSGTQTL